MPQFPKIAVRAVAIAVLASTAAHAVAQQAYPTKPIKIIVGVAPGGSTNNVARLIAQKLQGSLGQSVIVENRTGANTVIATEAVGRAAPDGYTLLVATNAHITLPLLSKLRYDPIKDFTPVGTVGVSRFVMSVHPSVPVNTLQEFIAYAKARPGQLNFGSSGSGGTSHIAGEAFNMLTGVRIQHIPYRGGGPSLSDSIAGQVQVSYNTPMAVAPLINAGKLKALAVTGPHRLPALPQVPTFAEAGLPAFDQKAWYGVFGPAGMPKPIVDKLAAALRTILSSPAVEEKLEKQGIEPFISTPEQFTTMMQTETAQLAKLVKAANIKLD
jgi:tripartite-type tricarboxylate transporter receptor subunit TctC